MPRLHVRELIGYARKVVWRVRHPGPWLYERKHLVLFSWAADPPERMQKNGRLEFRPLSSRDLADLLERGDHFAEQAELYYRKRGIESAFAVFVDGAIAHLSWLYTSREYSREPLVRLQLANDEAEIVNSYTDEAHRGLGAYPFALRNIVAEALEAGFRNVYVMTETRNVASIEGIRKAGFERCGEVAYTAILPRHRGYMIRYERCVDSNAETRCCG